MEPTELVKLLESRLEDKFIQNGHQLAFLVSYSTVLDYDYPLDEYKVEKGNGIKKLAGSAYFSGETDRFLFPGFILSSVYDEAKELLRLSSGEPNFSDKPLFSKQATDD